MRGAKAMDLVWRLERRLRGWPVLSLSLATLLGLAAWGATTGFGPPPDGGAESGPQGRDSAASASPPGGPAGAGAAGASVVEATELRLVTAGGELRGRLAVEGEDPVFQLLDRHGNPVVTVSTSPTRTAVRLDNQAGVEDASFYVDTAGAGIHMYGSGYAQLDALVRPWEGFSLVATDELGVPELQLFHDEDGDMRVRVGDREWPADPSR